MLCNQVKADAIYAEFMHLSPCQKKIIATAQRMSRNDALMMDVFLVLTTLTPTFVRAVYRLHGSVPKPSLLVLGFSAFFVVIHVSSEYRRLPHLIAFFSRPSAL